MNVLIQLVVVLHCWKTLSPLIKRRRTLLNKRSRQAPIHMRKVQCNVDFQPSYEDSTNLVP